MLCVHNGQGGALYPPFDPQPEGSSSMILFGRHPVALRPQGRRVRDGEGRRFRAETARHRQFRPRLLQGKSVPEDAGAAGRRLLPRQLQRHLPLHRSQTSRSGADPCRGPGAGTGHLVRRVRRYDPLRGGTEAKVFFNRVVAPRFLNRPGDKSVAEVALRDELPPILDYLETVVPGEGGFLLGDSITLADISVASPFANFRHLGIELNAGKYPGTRRYVNRSWNARASSHLWPRKPHSWSEQPRKN